MNYSVPLFTISLYVAAIFSLGASAQASPIVESVDGSVLIQRGRLWISPVPGQTNIERSDLIHVRSGSRAVVLCTPDNVSPNRQPLRGPIRSGIRGICDNSNSINRDFCTISSEFMGGQNPDIPYIITPRSGRILGDDILFRWNRVETVETYTVRLESPRSPTEWETIWTATTSETQIPYSGDVALSANVPYVLTVETDTGVASVENEVIDKFSRSFAITDETEDLEAALSALQTQSSQTLELSEEELILATATAYTCQDKPLTANAIAYLESALSELSDATAGTDTTTISHIQNSPLLRRSLGDLYYDSGLADLAEQNYLQAIKSADLNTHLDDWIQAQEGLARVYRRTNRTELAIHYLQQAELGAHYTCDRDTLDRIAASLTSLAATGDANTPMGEAIQPLSCEIPFD